MGLRSRQDKDNESFEQLSAPNEFARRVLIKNPTTSPIPVLDLQGLVLPKYNSATGAKPTSTREVYTYFLDLVQVGVLTIDFEDETKKFVTAWELA